MIVVSLLLILVAVVLLAMGLAGGSSTLLIASIAVSLLAAVALVIGARRAATMRRAALGADHPAAPVGPPFDDEAVPARARWASGRGRRTRRREPEPPPVASSTPFGPDGGPQTPYGLEAAYGPEPTFADSPQPTDEGLASPIEDMPRIANRDDAEAALAADAAYRAAEPVIAEAATIADPAGAGHWRGVSEGADPGGIAEEFGEPDEDDPDDEPLPQAVRPADAARVARMSDEVLVVDGRPRYHLAECPHLVGRLTEPLPVAEAVELGFSPCGLCRPVDRLVGQAAHR